MRCIYLVEAIINFIVAHIEIVIVSHFIFIFIFTLLGLVVYRKNKQKLFLSCLFMISIATISLVTSVLTLQTDNYIDANGLEISGEVLSMNSIEDDQYHIILKDQNKDTKDFNVDSNTCKQLQIGKSYKFKYLNNKGILVNQDKTKTMVL